jgi:pteridine reductase
MSSFDLSGRVAIVTGGNGGIGLGMAKGLAAAGAAVVVAARNREKSEAAVAALAGLGAKSAFVAVDVADPASCREAISRTIEQFGRIDILINNASTFYPTPVGEITRTQWDDLMGSNLRAPFFLAQAAAPSLRTYRGLIINIVDIHALRPLKRHPVYSIAKAGLAMLTRSLARELGPDIRVNAIAPGPVLWPEQAMDDELKSEIIAKTALKRHGTPQDVARAALFLAKDAPYVTGQIIAVDGGRSI